MAFVAAAICFVATVLISGVMIFGASMSDSPSASADTVTSAKAIFVIGSLLSAAILGSHWLPHIGW